MRDLISRQAALDIIDAELNGWLTDDERLHLEGVGTGIEFLPSIDPVRHGKWINEETCSVCGESVLYDTDLCNYCPNCGAKMERSEDETH